MNPMTLAHVPFLQPLDIHNWWWVTLVPLAFFLSLAYKGVRMKDISGRGFWRAVVVMSGQIVLGLMALAAALFVFVEVIVPRFQS